MKTFLINSTTGLAAAPALAHDTGAAHVHDGLVAVGSAIVVGLVLALLVRR